MTALLAIERIIIVRDRLAEFLDQHPEFYGEIGPVLFTARSLVRNGYRRPDDREEAA